MNTEEIYSILMAHELTAKHMGSVCASDQLPPTRGLLEKDQYFIVNLDPSHLPGSHWVACYMRKNPLEPNVFFDSYGFPPMIPKLCAFVGENTIYNENCLQHPESTACGQWCILFVWHQILGHDINCLASRFTHENHLRNDWEVTHFINRIFNTKLKALDLPFVKKQNARSRKENQMVLDIYNAV